MSRLAARCRVAVVAICVFIAAETLSGCVAATNSTSSGLSHTASNQDWTVTLWVARTSATAATSIPATVTVDNRTDHRTELDGCPGIVYKIALDNARHPNPLTIPLSFCGSWMSTGVHVFHTKVQTVYQGCGGGGTPPCRNPPRISPLPAGTYRTELLMPSAN